VAGIAGVSLAVRAAFAAWAGPFQDEALYWWAAGEAPGFSPHPPIVSLGVRWGVAILGHGTLGLRAASLVFGTGLLVLAYLLGRAMYDRTTGLWAAALVACSPLFAGAGAVATPDAPLLALWMLFVLFGWRAARGGGRRWWLAAGLTLAAGLYAKYTMVLALPCALAALCASKADRALLRRVAPWAAAALGLALFLPVLLLWDRQHGWAVLGYHLAARHRLRPSADLCAVYLFGHAGLLSPVLFAGVWWAAAVLWRAWRRGDRRAGWGLAFTVLPVLFFLPPSVLTKREMMREHWDAMGYATGVVGLAAVVAGSAAPRVRGRRGARRLGGAALGVGAAMSLVLLLGGAWPGPFARLGARLPTDRMHGWSEVARRVRAIEGRGGERPAVLVADSFAPAMVLGFYLDRRRDIYALNHRRNARYGLVPTLREWRMDEAALRERLRTRPDARVFYLHRHRRSSRTGLLDAPKRIHLLFRSVDLVDQVAVVRGGRPLAHFGLYECKGLREPAPAAGGASGSPSTGGAP